MQKAEYLLQGSDDSDLNSCIGFRHTDKYCEGLIPMRFSNCLVVVRDFFAPKLPAQELPDKIKALKKKGIYPSALPRRVSEGEVNTRKKS